MRVLILICSLFFALPTLAQLQTPQISPLQVVEQRVGITDIKVSYHRPSVKNRIIFGDLVPYDKIWRTGANHNTTIEFSESVRIQNQEISAGKYAMYTIPNMRSWEIIFYADTDNSGLPDVWEDEKVVARFRGEVSSLPLSYESFSIGFDRISHDSVDLIFLWEKTFVSISIELNTDMLVMKSIEETMENNPSLSDYYDAAVYYLETDKDMYKAILWMNKAIDALGEDATYFMYRQQALIYAKIGERRKAIRAAEKSLELARKIGNEDYINLNTKSIETWKAEK